MSIPRAANSGVVGPPFLRPRHHAILAWVLGLSTLLRLWFSFQFFGFSSGDDVEIVRAGFMRALGHDFIPWEIRNLFVSDVLISPLLYLASFLGVDSVRHLCWIATFPFIALASVNIILVYLVGLRWLNDGRAATLAAALFAFHWIPLGYGSTVYPRTVSTTCLLVAVVLIDSARRPVLGYLAAGTAIGVAFACRYSEAIFLLPILAVLYSGDSKPKTKIRLSVALGLGFSAATLVTVGLWDWLTWGRPFSSLIEFAQYTLIDKESSSMVKFQPWNWYLWRLPKWLPLTALPMFFGLRRYSWLRAPVLYAALPLIVLSAIPHSSRLPTRSALSRPFGGGAGAGNLAPSARLRNRRRI